MTSLVKKRRHSYFRLNVKGLCCLGAIDNPHRVQYASVRKSKKRIGGLLSLSRVDLDDATALPTYYKETLSNFPITFLISHILHHPASLDALRSVSTRM